MRGVYLIMSPAWISTLMRAASCRCCVYIVSPSILSFVSKTFPDLEICTWILHSCRCCWRFFPSHHLSSLHSSSSGKPDVSNEILWATPIILDSLSCKLWLWLSAMILLLPILYFSYFAMNIKAMSTIVSLLASKNKTCILSKKLIKVLGSCIKLKIKK